MILRLYPVARAVLALRIVSIATGMLWLFAASVISAPFSSVSEGGKSVSEYLPGNVTFAENIPTPEEYLGANIGAWHLRHDQVVGYMKLLAENSERITITETGRSHENRPLLLLRVTAPQNQQRLEEIRKQHLATLSPDTDVAQNAPLVLYMGYSIHGNEPSGSSAAMVIAYYLAAAQGPEIDKLLNESVVLLDPSLNPDGLARFAQWANMHKGKQLSADPEHREHEEGWPSGRTNHYWFDLNRDWLPLTHPESRARIEQFHRWRPHILTDFHEMGTDSTYFFQPGVRSRKNPWTPDANVTLTEELAKFHAQAFDEAKQLYFSEESFDDFYYGKGSTYPDAQGSIGILFEQASSRGHLQESINGPLAFSDTIQNQVTTSLSTFAGALANKPAILEYQSKFGAQTLKLAQEDDHFGYVVKVPDDVARVAALGDILSRHQIEYSLTSNDVEIAGTNFAAGETLFIPSQQPQYRLIKSLFSTRTSFPDNTFYDVSNWNLSLAFNLDYAPVNKRQRRNIETSDATLTQLSGTDSLPSDAYAYAFDWHHYYAPALLQALLEQGISARTAGAGFTVTVDDGQKRSFEPGSIVLPTALDQPEGLADTLTELSTQFKVPVFAIQSGLSAKGIDLGSRKIAPVDLPKVMLVGGPETNEYEIGEIWHYLDTQVGLPITLVEQQRLEEVTLADYSHIVFASGGYEELNELVPARIAAWVEAGGVLIGQKNALCLFEEQNWLEIEILDDDKVDAAFDETSLSYGDKDALYAKKLIAGAVYEIEIDPSHPLFYGYDQDRLPVFKTSNMLVKSDDSPFTTIANYTAEPLMAGYSAPELVKMIAGTTAVVAQPLGKGAIVAFTDNIHFRGYWYGTNKLMSNAIYQSTLIK